MKKILPVLLCVFGLVFPGQASVSNDKEIEILLKKPFLKASFEKQRKLKVLSRPFNTAGIILFQPDKGVIWQTRTPLTDTLVIKNNGEMLSVKENSRIQAPNNPFAGLASRIFLTLLSLDLEKIKQLFLIEKGIKQGELYSYILRPKEQQLANIIDKIILSGKSRMENIDIIEKSGDSTLVIFSNEIFDTDKLTSLDKELLDLLK